VKARAAGRLTRARLGPTELVGLPLTRDESAGCYQGFCNQAIWPLFHCFQGRVRFDPQHEAAHEAVNRRFARAVSRALRPLLPRPGPVLRALLDYDLIGFHTVGYLDNYVYACRRLLGASWDRERLTAAGVRQRAGVYPIGIDPKPFQSSADTSGGRAVADLTRVVRGRRLILGVDRLDYTKGIPERILALEDLYQRYPEWRRKVSFVQVAAPSRSRIPSYVEQKRQVDYLVGRVNGEYADHDWVPIRYLYRSYDPRSLARFYRASDVGLVTPLRDGMNLVAKEFVAAQDPDSPGVLVLSRFTGAAEGLSEAVLVNPYVPSDTADGIVMALSMPPAERRRRHRALLARVLKGTARAWSERFLADLSESSPGGGERPPRRPRR
jgi:trehalose-6-phosphate synthase